MHAHNNPFSIFGQFEFFRSLAESRGEEILKQSLIGVSEESLWLSGKFRRRIFTPFVTLWLFLLEALESNHSCRNILSHQATQMSRDHLCPCSLRTGAFVQARKKLNALVIQKLARALSSRLESRQSETDWRWKSRTVKLVDGSSLSMPDTKENQKSYPQHLQKKGVGSPLMRVMAVISLSTGSIIEFAFGAFTGKGNGEFGLFHSLRATFARGEILVFDRLLASFGEMSYLIREGVDFVTRLNPGRDLSLLKPIAHIGKNDWLYCLERPKPWHYRQLINPEPYNLLPEWIIVRVIKFKIRKKGMRVREVTLLTSLINHQVDAAEEIADLYRQRWQIEVDLRSIKTAMGMDILRCQTPEMIEKEVWIYVLAYNLIRVLIAEVARVHELRPREISPEACRQLLVHIVSVFAGNPDSSFQFRHCLLQELASEKIGHRKRPSEPRAVKRRPKAYPRLQKSRKAARASASRSRAA